MRFATFTHAMSRKTATAADEQPADPRCVADPAVAHRLHVPGARTLDVPLAA